MKYSCSTLKGSQNIMKFDKEDQLKEISIYLYLIKIESIKSEILISLNQESDQILINFDDFVKMSRSLKVNNWYLFFLSNKKC
jgi:hypothetical protein